MFHNFGSVSVLFVTLSLGSCVYINVGNSTDFGSTFSKQDQFVCGEETIPSSRKDVTCHYSATGQGNLDSYESIWVEENLKFLQKGGSYSFSRGSSIAVGWDVKMNSANPSLSLGRNSRLQAGNRVEMFGTKHASLTLSKSSWLIADSIHAEGKSGVEISLKGKVSCLSSFSATTDLGNIDMTMSGSNSGVFVGPASESQNQEDVVTSSSNDVIAEELTSGFGAENGTNDVHLKAGGKISFQMKDFDTVFSVQGSMYVEAGQSVTLNLGKFCVRDTLHIKAGKGVKIAFTSAIAQPKVGGILINGKVPDLNHSLIVVEDNPNCALSPSVITTPRPSTLSTTGPSTTTDGVEMMSCSWTLVLLLLAFINSV